MPVPVQPLRQLCFRFQVCLVLLIEAGIHRLEQIDKVLDNNSSGGQRQGGKPGQLLQTEP